MSTNKAIGQRIRERRKQLNMSQEELSNKMGFKSRSSINKIEIGGRRIDPEKINDFAKALDTTPNYLLGLDDDFVYVDLKIDKETREKFSKRIATIYAQLNEENKNDVEKYLEFLLEKQKQK